MDLKAFVAGESSFVEHRGFAGIVQGPPRKPLIAAIEGFAVAGGFEIALACDLIVAAKGARLGIPEVKRSLVAAGGALLRLPRRMPYHVAMELALTGEPITAERAAEYGLVNRVTEPGEAVAGARELAATIAANGPLALAASKRILVEAPGWAEDELWQKQAEISGPVFGSEDAREGATAFAEKRDPVWKGLLAPRPRASRARGGRSAGRGARRGRSPARCRARAGRRRPAVTATGRAPTP